MIQDQENQLLSTAPNVAENRVTIFIDQDAMPAELERMIDALNLLLYYNRDFTWQERERVIKEALKHLPKPLVNGN